MILGRLVTGRILTCVSGSGSLLDKKGVMSAGYISKRVQIQSSMTRNERSGVCSDRFQHDIFSLSNVEALVSYIYSYLLTESGEGLASMYYIFALIVPAVSEFR
jgi:hypothetical protein